MGPTGLDAVVSAITTQANSIAGEIPELATAALGIAVLVFGVRLGWRLVRSLAGR